MHKIFRLIILFGVLVIGTSLPAVAQSLNVDLGNGGGSLTGRIIQLTALISVLSLAPGALVMLTSFSRLVVVLSLLRSALGLQQTPPNVVIISLALFLTLFIMGPTFETAYQDGIKPLIDETITEEQAFDKVAMPFRKFMIGQTRPRDIQLFMDVAKIDPVEKAEETPLRVLIPSFMISELKRAFEIGFLLFIPFLVIDMLVASILMSMGMMMLPPVIISLPFKLIFFVLVDGWYMVAGSLVKSYAPG